MTAQLNHTIVSCRDQQVSARFLSDLLGLPEPTQFGPFEVVEAGNGVSLDFGRPPPRDHHSPLRQRRLAMGC